LPEQLPGIPAHDGAELCHCAAGAEHADGLQRADFAGARRLLRHRRLHRRDPDGQRELAVLGDHSRGRPRVPARGISLRPAGIAGALAAIGVQFASPDSFNVFLSLSLLVGVVVGGLASISGAFYGALFIQFVPNVADHISKAAPWAIYGVLLITFMYLMPSGVAGLLQMVRRRLLAMSSKGKEAR